MFRHPNSKNWYSQVYVDGKPDRVSTGTSDKRKAQNIHDARMTKVRKGEVIEKNNLTVTDLYESYFTNLNNSVRREKALVFSE